MRSVSSCKQARAGRGLVAPSLGILGAVVTVGCIGLAGCGEKAERSLTLVSPVLEPCNKARDPNCVDTFFSCAELKAERLIFEVGLFDTESTTVDCPAELATGQATVTIRYEPGLRFYAVNTSYSREEEQLNVAAGPFSEDEAATPWRMLLK